MIHELSVKQQRFVQEYRIDGNGTQAAIRAGYSAVGAPTQALRLLNNADIQAALAKSQNRAARRLEISAERIDQEYARLGFASLGDYLVIAEDGEVEVDLSLVMDDQDKLAAIAEITTVSGMGRTKTTIKLHDKIRALDSLVKRLGLAEPDRLNVTVLSAEHRAASEARIIAALEARAASLGE